MSKPLSPEQTRLVLEHLSLVRSVAWGMIRRLPRHVEIEELIANGNEGLVDAARRHTGQAFQFSAYAKLRITGTIVDGLRRADPITRHQHEKKLLEGPPPDLTADVSQAGVKIENSPDPSTDALTDLMCEADRRRIQRAIESLDERDRNIIDRYFFNDETLLEIARDMKLSESRISQLKCIAVDNLRKALWRESRRLYDDEEDLP